MTYFDQKTAEPTILTGSFATQPHHGKTAVKNLTTTSARVPARTGGTSMMLKTGFLVVALQFSPAGISEQALAETTSKLALTAAQGQTWQDFQNEIGKAKKNMMADPATALEYALKAQEMSVYFDTAERRRESLATSLWLQSEALLRVNRISEVRPLLDKALELVGQTGPETKLVGDLHLALAKVSRQSGDVDVALNSLSRAHDIFTHLGETRSQAIVLLSIGSIYSEARSFDKALEYFARGIEVYPSDPSLELSAANNSANALKELKDYDASLASFNRALEISVDMGSSLLQGRILTNMASVQVLKGDLDAAEASVDKALGRFEDAGDKNWSRFIWGIKADIFLARRETDKAVEFISLTFAGSDVEKTTASYRDMHEIAHRVYHSAGRDDQSQNHLNSFTRLDNKGREAGKTMSLALASAKFKIKGR